MNTKVILLVLLSVASFPVASLTSAYEWVNPLNQKVHTIFYQGMLGSQLQGAKYTGKHGFIATTGEQVVQPAAIDTIENLYPHPEIDEIALSSTQPVSFNHNFKTWPNSIAKKACELCTHFIWRYYQGVQIKPGLTKSTQTAGSYSIDLSKVNIAQEGDIANHARKLKELKKDHPNSPYIFYGVSRGAATTAQAVVKYAQGKEDLSNLKLVILEGCFDYVPNIMERRHPWLLSTEKAKNILAALASKVIAFRKEGPAPIKVIHDFPKDIPVAFITSAKDKEVPAPNTKNVVQTLKNAGHKNIYFLELKNSSHPNYMFDDKQDIADYQNFIHALYKKYNLPHIPEYAERGKKLIEQGLIK